uniref:Protein kinase domain-containing protein n=1 Tax=Trichuris muris TaxID=70415 RepID=A0A5S6QP99_TRIMR
MAAEEVRLDSQRLTLLEAHLISHDEKEAKMEPFGSGNSNSGSMLEVQNEKPLSSSNVETSDGSNQTDIIPGNCDVATPVKATGSDSREFSDEANNVEGPSKSKGSSPQRKADKRRTRKRTRETASVGDGASSLATPDATITKYFRGTSKPGTSKDNVGKPRMTSARRKLQPASRILDNAVDGQSDGIHVADDAWQNVGRSGAGIVAAPATPGGLPTIGNSHLANANPETGVYVQTDLTGNDMDRKDRRIAELERSLAEAASEIQRFVRQHAELEKLNEKYVDEHRKLLIERSILERRERRTKCMEDGLRFGTVRPDHRGVGFEKFARDGYAFAELDKRTIAMNAEKEEVARATQLLKKRKPVSSSKKPSSYTGSQQTTTAASDPSAKHEALPPLTAQEYYEQEEILRLRREQCKKEDADLFLERCRLEREQSLYIREAKRLQNEERSRYKDYLTLNKHYLLLSLLGKGGFSEVWRAFDLQNLRYVACKIHQVNLDWSEERKVNYVRHAIREKDIHKSLNHPRVVKLFDVFTIDVNTFCTVLEYCDGNDLDFYLKQNTVIPEKEARCIIMQVVRALKYLNEIKPPVIHYDLKPANILLSSRNGTGEIKITDFGLAKVMEDDKYDPAVGMELTSQGAGTYWYLPPECFDTSRPPKICSKVDVWSLGVIFFQCLYGQKPFGDHMSQSRVLETGTILNATSVVFPPKPQVSNEAKDFICCCLQYSREDRADVFQLYNHEYLKPKSHKVQAAASSSSANTSHGP